MAKKKSKKKVNKAAAIKAYLAEHPGAGPTAVAQALQAQGVDVNRTYVSNIKSQKKKRRGKRPTRKSASASRSAPPETTPAEDVRQAGELLYQAVDLVMKAGLKESKTLVEFAGKMVERIKEKK